MFITLSKAVALAFYAAVAASFLVDLPVAPEALHWARVGVLVLLGAHALEVLVFRKQVALYPGPFAVSALLTLLFGFLHWKPLADRAARG
jgi:uncharacterized protein YhhL (DUF1145 family)